MDRLRIGVIGLGWFGEIHAETIAGVANLELTALCTRTPDRLAARRPRDGRPLHRIRCRDACARGIGSRLRSH